MGRLSILRKRRIGEDGGGDPASYPILDGIFRSSLMNINSRVFRIRSTGTLEATEVDVLEGYGLKART